MTATGHHHLTVVLLAVVVFFVVMLLSVPVASQAVAPADASRAGSFVTSDSAQQ